MWFYSNGFAVADSYTTPIKSRDQGITQKTGKDVSNPSTFANIMKKEIKHADPNAPRTPTKSRVNDFIDYCLNYYGAGGMYNMAATREQVMYATLLRLEPQGEFNNIEVGFDTTDRELVLELLLDNFPEIVTKHSTLF